jgi:2-amino-4-hydroxy-6-hydroxymethyldihydropteridine diphosphokinase
MQPVIIAIGSNKGNRIQRLRNAHQFLRELSLREPRLSSIYLTEPVGPSERYFLNGVIEIRTSLKPKKLLETLQSFERMEGRPTDHPRWTARTIDLDIISYDSLVIRRDHLIIPHPEYASRLFVLKPLQDLHPEWRDPVSGEFIEQMIENAPRLQLKRTNLVWNDGKSI